MGESSMLAGSPNIISHWPYQLAHAPSILVLGQATHIAWHGRRQGFNEQASIWLTRHIDGLWTEPKAVASHSDPCWNPVLYAKDDSSLGMFYKAGSAPQKWRGYAVNSKDSGSSWSRPMPLPAGYIGPTKNAPLDLGSGRLLCGSSREKGIRRHVVFETVSINEDPSTWVSSMPVGEWRDFQAIQPALLELYDGELVALCRSNQGYLLESKSIDEGKTWSELTATNLCHPNSGFDAIRLHQGGFIVVYHNHASKRNTLHLAWSKDGMCWNKLGLVVDGQHNFVYPSLDQDDEGNLCLVYSVAQKAIAYQLLSKVILEHLF